MRSTIVREAFALRADEGTSKVMSLAEAVARYVTPGCLLHVAYSDARPNAALLEVARQFAGTQPQLRVVTSGMVTVQHSLVELDLIESVALSFAGENYPMARPNPAFQRAVAEGRVRVENWSLWTLVARLMAGAMGVPFMPVRSLGGSDMGTALRGHGYGEVDDPFSSGDSVGVVSALRPDVVLLQGVAADSAGNVVMAAPYGEAMWGSLASRSGVVACVERIVDTNEIRRNSTMVRIPAHKVLAVCEVPYGSHPYGMFNPGFPGVRGYTPDAEFIADVLAASRTRAAFRAWIDEWVLECSDHAGYLAKLGQDRMARLTEGGEAEAWVDEFDPDAPTDNPECTGNELLVVVGSRMIAERAREGGFDAVLAGVGLANLSAWSAVRGLKKSGVDIELMAEIGMFGYDPRPGEPFIFANRNVHTSKWLSDVSVVLGSLVSGPGAKALGVIGAAEIDEDFRTNSTYGPDGRFLVGSGGANDILSAVDEALVIVTLDPRRLVPRVSFVTCPGDRVRTVVTSGGVFERRDGRIVLTRYLPPAGSDPEQAIAWIRARCGWEFDVAKDLVAEPGPTVEELATVRLFDPQRVFLRGDVVAIATDGS